MYKLSCLEKNILLVIYIFNEFNVLISVNNNDKNIK